MKSLLIGFLILFPCLIFSQSKHHSHWESRKLLLGVIFTPQLSGPSNISNEIIVDNFRYREEGKFAFAFGLQARYKLSPKWEAQLRLQRTDKGYKQIFVGPLTISDKTPYNYRFFYISFPSSIRYNLNQGNISFYVFGGISPDVFMRSAGLKYEEEFAPLALSYLAGIGGEFSLKNDWFMQIEPIFMHALTALTEFRQYKPLSLGIAIGLYYDYRPEYDEHGNRQ